MTKAQTTGIAYKPLPADLQAIEREKSRLLVEAHMLKTQTRFTEAAERFAQAARHEEQLADWAVDQGLTDLHYLHAFSALSLHCSVVKNAEQGEECANGVRS